MLDIPSISAIVAAIGVIIGVALTYSEVRNLVKQRQTDLVMRLYSTFGSIEFQEARENVMSREFKDVDDYQKKYGVKEVGEVGVFFEGIGVLLKRKLIDISLVDDLFSGAIKSIWEKNKPFVEAWRKRVNRPQYAEWFEYLYNEMQKREHQLASKTA
jgi:hypothetical protein